MNREVSIVWFRCDLRIADNEAIIEAAKKGTVLPIYILDDTLGDASKWWLHNSLQKLDESLQGKLNFYIGDELEILRKIIAKYKVKTVFWNRRYEPYNIEKDSTIKLALQDEEIEVKTFNSALLWEPWEVVKNDETPYKVFTPFYRNGCLKKLPRKPFVATQKIDVIRDENNKTTLKDLHLLPKIKWYKEISKMWEVGEKAAQKKLEKFLKSGISNYNVGRDFPAQKSVSQLSPHLHFGEISPHQIWWKIYDKYSLEPTNKNFDRFLSELGWREFSYNLMYFFKGLPTDNFNNKFDKFPWLELDENGKKFLRAWKKGQTGIPIVDAGMRELWQTGYMHNRVRMIVGSFLVKNLLIDWREGAKWFWNCLVDADLANNSASWQWVAGSGADAAPYFRIFNPILQGEKFDADGEYVLKYVPELKNLPKEYLFKPWETPNDVLKRSDIVLGKTYPLPIIDIKKSRDLALLTYKTLSIN